MSLDLVGSYSVIGLGGLVAGVGTVQDEIGYLDSVGVFGNILLPTFSYDTGEWGGDTDEVFACAQIDGVSVMRSRNSSTGRRFIPDLRGSGNRYGTHANDPVVAGGVLNTPIIYELDPRTGTAKYDEDGPVILCAAHSIVVSQIEYFPGTVGLGTAGIKIVALIPGFILLHHTVSSGGTNDWAIFTIPSGVQTADDKMVMRAALPKGYPKRYASVADNGKEFWLCSGIASHPGDQSISYRDVLCQRINWEDWTTEETTQLRNYADTFDSTESATRPDPSIGAFWSRDLHVFVAVYAKSIKIFSDEIVKDHVDAPTGVTEYITPPPDPITEYVGVAVLDDTVPADKLSVVSISAASPAIVTVTGSLTTWMAAQGIASGDYVFVSDAAPFRGVYARNDTVRAFDQFAAMKINGANHIMTFIDDTHFSVPVDGAAVMDLTFIDFWEDFSGSGANRTFRMTANALHSVTNGTEVQFNGFLPADHPINGHIATVTVASNGPTAFHITVVLPWGSWPTIPDPYDPAFVMGYWKPYNVSGVYPLVGANSISPYVTAKPFRAGIINIDAYSTPPVFTVDRPDWLDAVGVGPGEACYTMIADDDKSNIWALYSYTTIPLPFVLIRLTANTFAIEGVTLSDFWSFTTVGDTIANEVNPMVYLGYTDIPIGSTVTFGTIPGMPQLDGVTVEIIENVDFDGYYRIGIDTTTFGMFDWDLPGNLEANILTLPHSYKGIMGVGGPRCLDVPPDPSPGPDPDPVPIPFTAGVGFEVYTYVEGDLNEPVVGATVTWSDEAGSMFIPEQSVTDSTGKATTICIVPKAYLGVLSTKNNIITATTADGVVP